MALSEAERMAEDAKAKTANDKANARASSKIANPAEEKSYGLGAYAAKQKKKKKDEEEAEAKKKKLSDFLAPEEEMPMRRKKAVSMFDRYKA